MTSTVEDYLKAIFILSEERGGSVDVPLGQVATRLGVTPGTVTTMMRHLSGRELIHYQPRRGVRLSPAGRLEALRVLRRHRIIELFLVQVMQLDWADVHHEAEALEHSVSEGLLERMDQMLGQPTHDPHGDPIPSPAGELPQERLQPLAQCAPGAYRIVRVVGDEASFLGWLQEQGFCPGSEVTLQRRDSHADTLTLGSGASHGARTIGVSAASALLVEPARSR
jgi:DtxR family Mn-dependent transcriptional regulator